jgi:DNA-directed RNA polymerase subunit beta
VGYDGKRGKMDSDDQQFRDAMLRGVKESLETESANRRLEVVNISVPKRKRPDDIKQIKDLRIEHGTFADKVYADLKIVDKKTNKTISHGRVHVADIPIKTPFKSYLIDGAFYQNTNQAQLKGTAYTRKKSSGEVASEFMLERGWNFDINLNPETEKFTLNIGGGKYPLFPILKTLGVSDDKIKETWGEQLLRNNQVDEKESNKTLSNFALKILGKKRIQGRTKDEIDDMIRNHFLKESRLNPEASVITLGAPYKNVDENALLASTKRIIDVYSSKSEPDSRDEIYFKRFRGLNDTGYEWIKERSGAIQNKIRRRIERIVPDEKINNAIKMDIVNPVIKSLFTQAKLRGAGDTTNLLDILSSDSKVTIMGEHGVGSEHRVNNEARDAHMSAVGFIDPVMTPQGSAGLGEHLAIGTEIKDGKLFTELINARTNKRVKISSDEVYDKNIVFPDEMSFIGGKYVIGDKENSRVKAVRGGKLVSIRPEDADYIVPSPMEMYSETTNLIPFLSSNSGGRAILATGQLTQAVPLEDPEPPLVRAQNFESISSFALNSTAPEDGTISRITEDYIKLIGKSGRVHTIYLYNNLPLNRESFLDSKPLVKSGDHVKSGQVLADNNFTKGGVLAIGKNLKTAIMPYKGYNYEDGQVISESAAKKLSSIHMYDLSTELSPKSEVSSGRFATYGNKYRITEENERNTDIITGLIKPGSVIRKGDVLARIVTRSAPDPEDNVLMMIKKSLVKPYRATPIVWENENPGIVAEANVNGKNVNIFVKSVEPAQTGDKLADRAGHKGVITSIVPDNEMPYNKETGEKIDVIIDPASIPSRVNIGQVLEMSASKIARKRGEPYIAPIHSTSNHAKRIKKELEESGIKDKTTVVDPMTGLEIPNINVADKYTMKLQHQVEHKLHTRSIGGGYDMDKQPIKGRALDKLTFFAMIGHGAKNNLAEMGQLKAESNDDWWAQYENGVPTVLPSEPTYAWQKFDSMLKGMGINIKREGDKMVLSPLTDKEIMDLSAGEITNVDMVRKRDFKPLPGGIFDPTLTGGRGTDAKQWTHIKLPEPVMNPIFSKAVSALTNMPISKLERISRGQEKINGKTGGEAIREMLDSIDVEKDLNDTKVQLEEMINKGDLSAGKINTMHKKLRFLKALNKYDLKPSEVYILNNVPVMPPVFRHPIVLPDGKTHYPAVNYLYKDVALIAKKTWGDIVTENTRNEVRKDLFDSIAALVGIGEPVSNADAPGLMKQITGKPTESQERRGISRQAKDGFFHKKVMRKQQELSSGAVISVEPSLNVDEVMMPEQAAWDMYKPMVIRKMIKQTGMSHSDATKSYEQRTNIAHEFLEKEMKHRPILINRAPSWHKFNIMAAWPKIHSGNNLKVPNLPINTYFGGDFDGDCAINSIIIRIEKQNKEVKNKLAAKIYTWYNSLKRGKNMPSTEKIRYTYGLVNLKDFPRVESSEKIRGSVSCYDVPKNIEALVVDQGIKKWLPVKEFSVHRNLELVDVRMHNSRSIQVSKDVSMVALDEHLNYVRVVPEIGLCVPRLREPINNDEYEPIKYQKIDHFCYSNVKWKKRIEINKEFGYLLGCYIGDGWIDSFDKINIANTDQDIIKKITEIWSSYRFDKRVKLWVSKSRHEYKGYDCYSEKYVFGSKGWSKYLKDTIGYMAQGKHLPGYWIQSPIEFRWGLLSGLIDTDGSVNIGKARSKSKNDASEQLQVQIHTASRRLAYEIIGLAHSLNLTASITSYRSPQDGGMYLINFPKESIGIMKDHLDLQCRKKKSAIDEWLPCLKPDVNSYAPILSKARLSELRTLIGWKDKNLYDSVHRVLRGRNGDRGSIILDKAKMIVELDLSIWNKDEFWKKWKQMVLDDHIEWQIVTEITDIPYITEAYDLTIPPSYTMVTESGIVIQDSMAMHIPITEEAVDEAKGMMPSKLFMKSGTGTLMLTPQGSAISGLYDLTKDPYDDLGIYKKEGSEWLEKIARRSGPEIYENVYTVNGKKYIGANRLRNAYESGEIHSNDTVKVVNENGVAVVNTVGREVVSSVLPNDWHVYGQLDSKKINKVLTEISKDRPAQLAQIANELTRLGDQHATNMGFSIGVDDIISDNRNLKHIVRSLDNEIIKIDEKYKSMPEYQKDKLKMEEFNKLLDAESGKLSILDNETIKSIPNDSTLLQMWKSGAKGNLIQLRQTVGPPMIFSTSSKDLLKPVMNSYSHGLTPAEYYIQQSGGRFGLIQRSVGISEPGDIGKDHFSIMASKAISEEDCGTTRGIKVPVDRRDAIGRYVSEDTGSIVKRNEIITEDIIRKLKQRHIKSVMVRSPLCCQSKQGVCSKCYGVKITGDMPKIGDPIGVEDTQGIIDIVSNMALKSWHLSGSKDINKLPFFRYRRLVEMNKNVQDKAVLAKENGVIDKIKDNPLGGKDVYINSERYRLPANLGISSKVAVGKKVLAGQMLTDSGNIKPQELLEIKGIDAVQNYMVDEMADIFKSDAPNTIHRKVLENIVASITGLARVNDPGDSDYLPYDVGSVNGIEWFNKHRVEDLNPKKAIGYHLAKSYGADYPEGTEITLDIARKLNAKGHKTILVKKKGIRYENILKPIRYIPMYSNDWLSRLNHKYLQETLEVESAAGGEADIHGPDPVPAFAYGAEFGRGKMPTSY